MATAYCPACDKPFMDTTMGFARMKVRDHLRKWAAEGDKTHILITEMEGWEEQPFLPT